jgi:hypothetical protein
VRRQRYATWKLPSATSDNLHYVRSGLVGGQASIELQLLVSGFSRQARNPPNCAFSKFPRPVWQLGLGFREIPELIEQPLA